MSADHSLSPEAQKLLEALAKGPPVSSYVKELQNYETRRKWLCAAWLLGASFRQLAMLHEVTPATVIQLVNKAMAKEARNAARLSVKLGYSELSWYKARFQDHIAILALLEPADIARWLMHRTPFTED